MKAFRWPKTIAKFLLVSLGLTTGAFGQANPDAVEAWQEYMSLYWRQGGQAGGFIGYFREDGSFKEGEDVQLAGARFYLTTTREVLQTGTTKAAFQNGTYEFALADGYVPDIDQDLDAYTDEFERNWFNADYLDPDVIPRDAFLNPLPIDAFGIFLFDGSVMGIANTTVTTGDAKAFYVNHNSGTAVRLIAAPAASAIPRPDPFTDFSGRFNRKIGGLTDVVGLPLYILKKEYPNPGDASKLESAVVPGSYNVEFPTLANPSLKAQAAVTHRTVPNGALTKGLKKPTWLVRKLSTYKEGSITPTANSWVNGRLKFDPNLLFDVEWDSLTAAGLASSADRIQVTVRDENDDTIGDRIFLSAATSKAQIDIRGIAPDLYPSFVGTPSSELVINGSIKLEYARLINGSATADLSRVTLRVPVAMAVSYDSWRRVVFGSDSPNDSIAAPNADPDNDGLTNQQEFDLGTDPFVPSFGVIDPTAANITSSSAVLGGTVVVDPLYTSLFPGDVVTIYERGVVYSVTSTNSSPVIGGPGVGRVPAATAQLGTFSVLATGLLASTQYSYSAYAVTDHGTFYTSPVATFVTTAVTIPTVTTNPATNIASNLAVVGGEVSNASTVIERGVVISKTSVNSVPVIDGTGVNRLRHATAVNGVFSVAALNLDANTQYSFRAYVITGAGAFYSTQVLTFVTLATPPVSVPTVISPTSNNILVNSAILGGTITSSGGANITERGVVYSVTSLNNNPIIGGPSVSKQVIFGTTTGAFSATVPGLLPNTTYSFRAYAINSIGTGYTVEVGTFTTVSLATITSPTSTNITSTSATLGGNVTSSGGGTIVQRGVVFSSTNTNPTVGGSGVTQFAAATTGTGVFTVNATGLTPSRTYFFKAYVVSSASATPVYTAVASFATPGTLGAISTPTLASLGSTSVTVSANVTSDGGSTITQRGFVYSVTVSNSNPLIGGPGVTQVVSAGTTTGVISEPIAGLSPNTGYSVKGYVTNSSGTAYSSPWTIFNTLPAVQLLGQTVVQWAPVTQPTVQVQSETTTNTTEAQSQSVPEIIYVKDVGESIYPLIYGIEISTDAVNWQPIDENDWLVEDTAETISARWSSTGSPPVRAFFRVSAVEGQ